MTEPISAAESSADSELTRIVRAALQPLSDTFRGIEIAASFYPYIGLTHTIKRRGAIWVIRISDHCRHAPAVVLSAIAVLLGYKILRKKPPPTLVEVYEAFRHNPEIESRVQARRRQKGRKQIQGVQGRYHSLAQLYAELNRRYFNDQVEIRKLGWGTRKSWRRLGHYDPVHHTITISPVLDSPKVPAYALGFLLYHEMLHTLFDAGNGRRKRHHPREYSEAERGYPDYDAARRFLDHFCRTRGRW